MWQFPCRVDLIRAESLLTAAEATSVNVFGLTSGTQGAAPCYIHCGGNRSISDATNARSGQRHQAFGDTGANFSERHAGRAPYCAGSRVIARGLCSLMIDDQDLVARVKKRSRIPGENSAVRVFVAKVVDRLLLCLGSWLLRCGLNRLSSSDLCLGGLGGTSLRLCRLWCRFGRCNLRLCRLCFRCLRCGALCGHSMILRGEL